jgi:fructose-1-phosphate kinase PfkB-like protein
MSFLTVCLNPTIQKTLRFSSIIPGAVNRTGIHRLDVSGKGINVTRVLTQLGKKALHLTQLGGVMRPLFLSLCEQDGLSVEWVESGSEIRFCYTVLNDDIGAVTELVEESDAVCAGTEQRLLEKFDSLLGASPDLKCLIISGTKAAGFSEPQPSPKGEGSPPDTVIPYMTRKAKERGLRVILDVKGKDLIESLQYEPDVIKPNLLEFVETFAPDLVGDNDQITENDAARERIKSTILDTAQKYNCRVILTNGSRKTLAADRDKFFEAEFEVVKAVNSTGCGDAFTAGLAAALEDGASFFEAIGEGARCGARNALLVRPGVVR